LRPSLTGEPDAGLLVSCMYSRRGRGASRFQRILPVARWRAIVRSFSPSYAVTKIREPTTIGEECPGGSSVFQTTFFLGAELHGEVLVGGDTQAVNPAELRPVGSQSTVGENQYQCEKLPHFLNAYQFIPSEQATDSETLFP